MAHFSPLLREVGDHERWQCGRVMSVRKLMDSARGKRRPYPTSPNTREKWGTLRIFPDEKWGFPCSYVTDVVVNPDVRFPRAQGS